MCSNTTRHQACNFAVAGSDPNLLCVSCRQARVLPDLGVPGNHQRWYRIEVAKRRLFYTLAKLGLVAEAPRGERDDAYPFALSANALRKLRFVHDLIHDRGVARPRGDVSRFAA